MSLRVFILEDEPDMIRIATDLLQGDGFFVTSAVNPIDALSKIRLNPPDLLILDIRLPDMNGYEVCKQLKADPKTAHIPVIMVSAKVEETDVVVGLEVGAEDYICKPFRSRELLARVRAVLRRQLADLEPKTIVCGPLTLHCGKYTATLFKKEIQLTLKEFDLLGYFMRMEGRVLTRTKLYEGVWGVDFTGSSRTIDVHVDQLRKKLGRHSEWITTLKGIGYRFQIAE